jgi:hypothetical protein
MTTKLSPKRVIGKVAPIAGEGARGYLRRVAAYWRYGDMALLLALAGAREGAVDRPESAEKIAFALRLGVNEWQSMANSRLVEEGEPGLILFSGKPIGYGQFTAFHPRVCIECLRERLVEWKTWELMLMTSCASHGCKLIDACPKCAKTLRRNQAKIYLCSCGHDLRESKCEPADTASVALAVAIERAIGKSADYRSFLDIDAGFPTPLKDLELDQLLQLTYFLGRVTKDNNLGRSCYSFRRAALVESNAIVAKAGSLLADWPRNFVSFLNLKLQAFDWEQTSKVTEVYPVFYRGLYGKFSSSSFEFVRSAFEQFMLENWKGEAGGNSKWLSPASRSKLEWHPLFVAAREVGSGTVRRLLKSGELDVVFPRNGKGNSHRISAKSLNEWQHKRQSLITQAGLIRLLGLSRISVLSLVDAGLIRYAPSVHSARESFMLADGLQMLEAFGRRNPPLASVWDKTKSITIHEARKTILIRPERLACVFLAIIDDKLFPVAKTEMYSGIGGFIFSIADLQIHCHPADPSGKPVQYLNYSQSAQYLGIQSSALSCLLETGHLRPDGEGVRQKFRELLIPITQLEAFSKRYVAVAAIAKRLKMSSKVLLNQLKKRAIPVSAIAAKDGVRHLFVPRLVADKLEVPREPLSVAIGRKGERDLAA